MCEGKVSQDVAGAVATDIAAKFLWTPGEIGFFEGHARVNRKSGTKNLDISHQSVAA